LATDEDAGGSAENFASDDKVNSFSKYDNQVGLRFIKAVII